MKIITLLTLGVGLLLVLPVFGQIIKGTPGVQPPWAVPPQNGKNFTIPGIENVPDLHGDINNPDLVVFFNGNQFMVVNELMDAFKKAYPEFKKVFAETLPPGILADQIKEGAIIIGNMRIDLQPDVFTALTPRIEKLDKENGWFDRTEPYIKNRLGIMVYKNNPLKVSGLNDLAGKEIRVAMPNPKFEGIAKFIIKSYNLAGGSSLEKAIMETKVADGSTTLTRIHHRETPMWIMEKKVDAGPVWQTEAIFQQGIGNPVEWIKIPDNQNVEVTYMAGMLKNAPHKAAAKAFMDFLISPAAQDLYEKYGFIKIK